MNKINILLNLENININFISVTSTISRTISKSSDLEIIELPSHPLINTPRIMTAGMSIKALQEMRGWQQSSMNRPNIPGKYSNKINIVNIHTKQFVTLLFILFFILIVDHHTLTSQSGHFTAPNSLLLESLDETKTTNQSPISDSSVTGKLTEKPS